MPNRKTYRICVIGGDGLGPEVIKETIRVLEATKVRFTFDWQEAGWGAYQKYKTPLPAQTLSACRNSEAILFGAVTTPPYIKNYFSPIIALRKKLNLYANVRPIFSLPLPDSKQDIDLVLIRENTEGLYSGREKMTKNGAIAERVISRKGCKKIVRFAFQFAKKTTRRKITAVHKANVLRLTDGLFLQIAQEEAGRNPQIVLDDVLVDSAAYRLVKKPEEFDVIVTTNMFGDILSDLAAALVGGLGVAASSNLGKKKALFEPIHGSAPKYAGKNRANPVACIFAARMMLDYLGESETAELIKKAIFKVTKQGCTTADLGGTATTREVTDEIIKVIRASYVHR